MDQNKVTSTGNEGHSRQREQRVQTHKGITVCDALREELEVWCGWRVRLGRQRVMGPEDGLRIPRGTRELAMGVRRGVLCSDVSS